MMDFPSCKVPFISGRKRGGALATVLGLMAVVLTVGLALGTASTLSLNMVRSDGVERQSALLARSGLAQFQARVWEMDESADFNILEPSTTSLAESFGSGVLIDEPERRCTISFTDDGGAFSTDNLSGETPKSGWMDRGGSGQSVPPFSLEVLLRTEYYGQSRLFRVLMRRTWPYAIYSRRGPVVLMGHPDSSNPDPDAFPSYVRGKIFTAWDGNGHHGGSGPGGYGLGWIATPADLLAHYEARQGYHPTREPWHILMVGLHIGEGFPVVSETYRETDDAVYVSFPPTGITVGDNVPWFQTQNARIDRNNVVDGEVHYDHSMDMEFPPYVAEGNTLNGDFVLHRGLHPDPLADLPIPSMAGAVRVVPREVEETAMEVFDLDRFTVDESPDAILLNETLRLSPSVNSTGGATSALYEVPGSLTNRNVLIATEDITLEQREEEREYPKDTLFVQETRAGLELQSCTLHIAGDLDLGAENLGTPVQISGNDATIVVDGRLVISGGRIDAGDQGFVIYADHIVLKAGGSYKGLMVARQSITILPEGGNPLVIDGGIMCAGAGGVLLKSIEVRHNPRYLKSVNGAGELMISSWEALPGG